MPFFRLCPNNKLVTATLTATGHNEAQPPSNLLNDIKVSVLGKAGTSLTLVAVFPALTPVRCVASVATNLTSSGTAAVRLTSDAAGVNQVGLHLTAPALGGPAGVGDPSKFPYGVLGKFSTWFPEAPPVRRVELTLTDTSLTQVCLSHLYLGDYWEAPSAPVWGLSTGWDFSGDQALRNQAGDLVSVVSPTFDRCSLTLEGLSRTQRQTLQSVARGYGSRKVLVAFTDDTAPDHDGLVYGAARIPDLQLPSYYGTSVQVDVEGW